MGPGADVSQADASGEKPEQEDGDSQKQLAEEDETPERTFQLSFDLIVTKSCRQAGPWTSRLLSPALLIKQRSEASKKAAAKRSEEEPDTVDTTLELPCIDEEHTYGLTRMKETGPAVSFTATKHLKELGATAVTLRRWLLAGQVPVTAEPTVRALFRTQFPWEEEGATPGANKKGPATGKKPKRTAPSSSVISSSIMLPHKRAAAVVREAMPPGRCHANVSGATGALPC